MENFQNFLQIHYNISDSEAKISPFGAGLINYSWVVEISGKKLFLQKLNTAVFKNVNTLENNLKISQKFLEDKNFPLVFPILNTKWEMHTEYENSVFRVYHFVENADTHQVAPSVEHIFSAAKKFGEFSKILTPIAENFMDTIPHFHNLSARYEEFKKICENTKNSSRFSFAKAEIETIKNWSWMVETFENFQKKLPKRVYHHDAKINNILFEKNSHNALFPVDLDTIMAGYIFSDFGDMVWSMVFGIDHNHPKQTFFDRKKYDALVNGYLEGFWNSLSDEEIRAMHFGGIVMSYMLAIRFLADFLNGDKYFKTTYENHNFDRAKWQIDIVKQLLENIGEKI